MSDLSAMLDDLNERFLALHEKKERVFWETRMGIADRHDELAEAELALRVFTGDPEMSGRLRTARKAENVSAEQGVVLEYLGNDRILAVSVPEIDGRVVVDEGKDRTQDITEELAQIGDVDLVVFVRPVLS